jgi:replicative DNA helicase
MTRCYEEHGCRMHVIDYMQLAWTGDAATRYDRITEISHAVRATAKRLRVVTVALSQMNRDGIKTPGKPQKESMDGGGSLEQDADQVLLMDHSRKKPAINAEGRNRGWIGWMILDKNRHGEEPEIPVRFHSETFRIRERLPDEIGADEMRDENRRHLGVA